MIGIQEQYRLRKLILQPDKHGCVINIAHEFVKHLKLNKGDVLQEELYDNDGILIRKVNITKATLSRRSLQDPDRRSEDGVVG